MSSERMARLFKRSAYFRHLQVVVAAVMSANCKGPVDPALPTGAVRFDPPAVYATWWQMVQSCSSNHGELSAVSWYQVPGTPTIPFEGGGSVGGYWSEASNEIVLAGASTLDGGLVRHEMLHALVRVPGHPRAEFLAACAGTVECDAACIDDAGPPPPPNSASVTVTPDKLHVTVSVAPSDPRPLINDGFLAVTVLATNPTRSPMIVALPGSYPGHIGAGFEYRLENLASGFDTVGTVAAFDSAVVFFAAGETKRYVFDFRVQSATWPGLVPGAYLISGSYGLQWTESFTTLSP